MSSGYSSLEEDAEDFFFTARTSFFRRAPQGKPRTGQQVSGARGGTPDATCLGGERVLAGREEGAAAETRRLPLWIPGSCFELVRVGVPECTGGVPGEGRRGKGREAAGWPLPSAPDGLCGSAWGSRLRGSRSGRGGVPRPLRAFPLRPGTPFAAPQSQRLGARAGGLLASSVACGPLSGLVGCVIATGGRGNLASPTFLVQAPGGREGASERARRELRETRGPAIVDAH